MDSVPESSPVPKAPTGPTAPTAPTGPAKLKNPFPVPSTVDPKVHQDVVSKIKNAIKENKKIEFHDLLKSYENAIITKRLKYSKIIGYYCVNALIKTSKVPEREKKDIIGALFYDFVSAFNVVI